MADEDLQRYKIFLGNLPYSLRGATLRETGEQFGEVIDCKLIVDKMTGRCKGIGFLTYQNEDDFERALKHLHGSIMEGREIRANPHQEKTDRDGVQQKPEPRETEKKIFLGNLAWTINEKKLREIAEPYGELVECKVIYDKMTGQSKGFGFLKFTDDESFETALENINGTEVDGRAIRAIKHQPKDEAGPSSRPRANYPQEGGGRGRMYEPGGGRGGMYESEHAKYKIYVGGIPYDMDTNGLRKLFEKFGEIEYAAIGTDKQTGKARGYGFVTFHTRRDMEDAIVVMDGREVSGRMIKVVEANKTETKGAPPGTAGRASISGLGRSRYPDDPYYDRRPLSYDDVPRADPYASRDRAYPSSRLSYDDPPSVARRETPYYDATASRTTSKSYYDEARPVSRVSEDVRRPAYADERGVSRDYGSGSYARPPAAAAAAPPQQQSQQTYYQSQQAGYSTSDARMGYGPQRGYLEQRTERRDLPY
mmetsp:Transcript_28523/g.37315  ORF Transcript_28523/g.37315 Transcript_28523/m.37315 type:complete len:479 (-) Transcript_28523:253-1689(-)